MPPPYYDFLIKLLLIGDSVVAQVLGSPVFLLRFCDDEWMPLFITTIGIDFKIHTIELDGKCTKLQIWDTAGQEWFRAITTVCYCGAMGILLVYNITDEQSYDSICTWHTNIEQHASEGVNMILVSNKSDWTDKRTVPEVQGHALAEELGMKFMETSAKANEGVEEAFFTIARFVACSGVSSGGASNADGSVKVNQPATSASIGCCS
ncbi:rab-type small GTP-binding protein [Suillus cothurnatus]|nr:rab-type small GTP-binding protein [Suillus cothurnatus]